MIRPDRVKKKAVSLACTVCKKRKLKCDGNNPCSRCNKLKTPEKCSYCTDRRKDKRKVQNGSRVFVFKNQNIRNENNFLEKNDEHSEDLLSDKTRIEIAELEPHINLPEFDTTDIQIVDTGIWSNSLLTDFDFNNFSTEGADVGDFLKLLGDSSFPIGKEDLSYSPGTIDFNTLTNSVTGVTESEDYTTKRSHLINILFEDESHAPPGISKRHLLDLELKYGDLESTEGSSDGKFLLATSLCLGSLTIRKRELLNPSSSQDYPLLSENGIPKLTADAYKYYTFAKALIPDLLPCPTIDGFCGLVLMANFMTMMISLEGQLYLSINALQIAVALNLNNREKCKELIELNAAGVGLVLLFWNIWCSSCMLTTFQGRKPFITLEDITTPLPCELHFGNKICELSINFMQLRIQLAAIQGKIFKQLYISGPTNKDQFLKLQNELEEVSIQINRLKSCPIFEERLFYRSQVLMLELSSFKAQTSFLLYRPYLISAKSLGAVNAAKSIIHEIWSHYTKQFPKNEKEIVEHLDWNFCYPLRTASLTLCISCVILLRYKHAIEFLKDRDLFEYVLAIEILQDLVQLLPIERKLIDLVETSNEAIGTTRGSNIDGFVEFWGCMLDRNSP
ncbi:hypothetical protein SUVZ_14G3850 [Saccharomyces uvarum]|uniref:Zn(2)-C6 fungal-type domain-containing protein n=1 Tax=Saccharomyces uvarum TaxID=230603 RepID=A0ABN8WRC5_SACUV|nr:hypothetical protein SUVZ_14G3850 [Saccharomyces uvarum]